jgi:molybdopterin molybdotransferase
VNASPSIATIDEAIDRLVVAARIDPIATESVSLEDAFGRTAASSIPLDRDHPPFDRAMMDGIACRSTDVRFNAMIHIERDVPAGADPGPAPPPGTGVRIATGAAVPKGLDAVIERECLVDIDPRRVRLEIDAAEPGRRIHARGSDGRAGKVVIAPGMRLDAMAIGVIAACGHPRPMVVRRPTVAILATGDELRGPDDRLEAEGDDFRIRDGNRPMLTMTMRALGAHVVEDRRVADDLDATTRALADLIDGAELVITIGGVSAGDRDFVPIAAARLGLEPCLRGVQMQPGFPASAWCDDRGRLRLAALPGNPVSCLVTTHVLVRPWLETRLGRAPAGSWRTIRMAEAVQPNPRRTACRPAIATSTGAVVPGWNGSGDLPHVVGTHGIVRLPEQARIVEAGIEVPWLPWRADA